ncbi:MAG: hypothetical protein PHY12_14015 [Eubacteriales bacterium]|nr:hypothetical protein [Eubacteriales bacterium]
MQQTFEHLLGLTAESALAILKGYGISDVRVTPTAAPPRRAPRSAPADAPDEEDFTSLRVVAVHEDGRELIVSRFHTGDPKPRDERRTESAP